MSNITSPTMSDQHYSTPSSPPPPGGIAMQYDIYSVYQYPWMSFNFFLLYWLAALITYKLHWKLAQRQFDQLGEGKRRNVVTYVLQSVAITVALGYQIYGGIDLLFRAEETTTPERIQACNVSLVIISTLYVWELLYRIDIGFPLLVHHIVTLILIQVGYCSFFDTGNLWYFRYGLLLCFHATTEQFCFLAIYCYRMNVLASLHKRLFQLAALQAAVIKTLVTVALVVYFVLGIREGVFEGSWGLFWKITFPPLLLVLYLVQMYSSYILVTISRRCGKQLSQDDEDDADKRSSNKIAELPDGENRQPTEETGLHSSSLSLEQDNQTNDIDV